MLYTVIGTQNTGKSTFIQDFLKEFPGFICPTIDYRSVVRAKKLKLNREGNLYSQEILFSFILNDSRQYTAIKDDTILDRSIIDAYVYTSWLWLNKPSSGVTAEAIAKQYKILQNEIHMYDKIFFCPIKGNEHVQLVDDQFRDINEEYRKDIDILFQDTLKRLGVKYVTLSGTREERIEIVKTL